MGKFVVYIAYHLKSSHRYQTLKAFFYDLLENPRARIKSYSDLFMMALVLSSVFLQLYAVKGSLGRFGVLFEHVVVTIFIIEYLLRMWIYNDNHKIIIERYEKAEYLNTRFGLAGALREVLGKKVSYMTSAFAIIDLLAILPSYRPLRILRVFLIFRLFKLFRYARSINEFLDVLSNKRFELYTLGIFLSFVVFASSTAIYLFESGREDGQIKNLYDAVYWSLVTMSTVGYGDITPKTNEGRFVTLVLIIVGISVISFFTSIIITAFNEKMFELRENRVFAELEKYSDFVIVCGYGRVGQEVVVRLADDKQRFVIIDQDEKHIALAKKRGYLAVQGNAAHNEILENAGINGRARAVLCITSDDVINVYVTLTAHHLIPEITIISRANEEHSVKKLYQAGADQVIRPFEIVGLTVAEYVGQPVAFEAIYSILRGEQDIRLEAVFVHENAALDGQTVGQIAFATHKLILFGVMTARLDHVADAKPYALRTRHFYFNPSPEFVVHSGDILVVFGHEYSIDHMKNQLEKSRLRGRA